MDIHDVMAITIYLCSLTLVIAIVYSMLKAKSSVYKYIVLIYLIISLFFYQLGQILFNNLILIPLFAILELACFSILYYRLTQNKFSYIITIPTIVCFLIELTMSDFQNIETYQTYTRFFSLLTMVVLAIFYSYLLIKQSWQQYNASLFLLNANVLIYASFSCLIYLMLNLLINLDTLAKFWFWIVNMIATLIFNIVNTKVICGIGKMKEQ